MIISLLTIITQLGGLIWLIALVISLQKKWKKRLVFPLIYLTFNLLLIPPIASFFGREKLPWIDNNLKPINWFYPLAFRNYVNPQLKVELKNSANALSLSSISITYLDANFPFIDGFPLLPHLSHNDGKKIDIAFMYLDKNSESTENKPSSSGYGAFVNSKENYTSNFCINKGYWQYDFTKYLTFGTNNNLKFDESKTAQLINELLSISSAEKIFIEPHLKKSLGLGSNSNLRFQGCAAVRHDDHIHFQIK